MREDPLERDDPRLGGGAGPAARQRRELVASRGPGGSPEDPRVRFLRGALPVVFVAGLAAVALVFWLGLDPGSGVQLVGPEAEVRAALRDRPHRVCLGGNQPCAWLTVVDGALLALDTSGPLREEFGRQGVGWCPTSGYFGSNTSGSRFDPAGRVARGPAPRGLDRFDVRLVDGQVAVDFLARQAGLQSSRTRELLPPAGPHCPSVPFDREADLRLPADHSVQAPGG